MALLTAILATVAVATARAEDTKAAVSKQELQAKMTYCEVCHGPSGQGFRGYYPIPRLAGQQPEYFKNQLQAFIERRRTNPIMFNVAHVLSPAMLAALAANFHDLNPKPLGGASEGPRDDGKKDLSKKEFPTAMFRRALRVTVRRPKATDSFLAWQVSSLTTSSTN